jgi:signal transduction histidine kinase
MWAIGSTFRRRWLEILWACFAAANVVVIFRLGEYETIPFHLVWVSLTLLYGIRLWSLRATVLVLGAVCAATGAALIWAVTHADPGPGLDEVAEVPLMASMFVAMVWHARRRQRAMEEVRSMAEKEHRLLERQREFVRDASHELRTPITVARGHAELIRSAAADPQVARDAEVVIDELGRLGRLSDRLLLLAALERPGFLAPGRLRLGPLIEGTARKWEVVARRRWRASAAAAGVVVADEERLRIALDALIENAVKFTEEGDTISIAAYDEQGGGVVIEVRDSGEGIRPEMLERIFDRFTRGSGDERRGPGGTGLGLAIVRAIAEAHGGSVEVSSVPGAGAAFRIRLPSFEPSGASDSLDLL